VFHGLKNHLSSQGSSKETATASSVLKSLLTIIVENKDILSVTSSQEKHRLLIAQLLLDTLSVGIKGLLEECISTAAIISSETVNSFNYFLSQKNDPFLALLLYSKKVKSGLSNRCHLEEEFLELLLTVVSILSTISFESSTNDSFAESDNYFQSENRSAVETTPTTVVKDEYWFRVDIIRLLAVVTHNALLTILLAWTSATTITHLQNLRLSLSSALLSWLQVSEAAVKRDIAQSLSMLCVIDVEDSRDYLTHITRLLVHKAGLLFSDTSRSINSSSNERLNSVTIIHTGSLKCLQSVSTISILALLSDQHTASSGDQEVARIYNSVLTSVKKKLSDTIRSDVDTALTVTNALDCLDGITMSGCLVLSDKYNLNFSSERKL